MPARSSSNSLDEIRIIGASEHNLKGIDATIPRRSLTVITGLSGSGKSSLAFDTLYAEGQRRYIESLSSYARQFLDALERPAVEAIEGLSPAISIEQKTARHNPRSTVGTVSEIYDYLRVLYSAVGAPHCPDCGRKLERQSREEIADRIMRWPEGTRLMIMAPIVRGRKGIYRKELHEALMAGFVRAKINGEMRMLDEPIKLDRQKRHNIQLVIDRIILKADERARIESALDVALGKSDGIVSVEILPWKAEPTKAGEKDSAEEAAKSRVRRSAKPPEGYPGEGEYTFSEALACPDHGAQLVELAPRVFSFNSPHGYCQECRGIGSVPRVTEERIVFDPALSVNEGAILPWSEEDLIDSPLKMDGRKRPARAFTALVEERGLDLGKAWSKWSKNDKDAVLWGSFALAKRRGKTVLEEEEDIEDADYVGPARALEDLASDADFAADNREALSVYLEQAACPKCNGARLKETALAVSLRGKNISEFSWFSVQEARKFFEGIDWDDREWRIGRQAIQEIGDRLRFLDEVGVGYLSLDRSSGTLAGGELQRIRLATQIGSQLSGVLYVLDEPSIGLHMRDHERLLGALARLRDLGNTVVVVEHDEATMRAADWLIDIGPGAGRLGGKIMSEGPPNKLPKNGASLTAAYLQGKEKIPVPKKRRKAEKGRAITIKGAAEHNLQKIDATFPLGCFVCVTGVSGSGKSTLVNDILYPAVGRALGRVTPMPGLHREVTGLENLDKIIEIDQRPIGRTPRSNCATYTQVFTQIRDLFANLSESRMHGWKPGHFSFNVSGGRCENCKGAGRLKLEMAFLPDVYVTCDICRGRRYTAETLEVKYRDKSIADVLEMTVGEAVEFFDKVSSIRNILQTVNDVGLDYIHLGQPATTLSGGEAQRIKLSRELAKRNTGQTLYLLDEPTTGLHFADVAKLIEVLQRLVDAGSTVIVIEHNLDVIKSADWVIDLGPEGGTDGGQIVAEGTPEKIAKSKASHTGRFLHDML